MHRIGRFAIDDQAEGPGARLGWHSHDAHLLSIVLHGHYEERYQGCALTPRAFDVVVKPGGERHADRVRDTGARSLLVSLPTEEPDLGRFALGVTAPRLVSDPSIRHLAQRAAAEWIDRDDLSELALESLLLEIVVQLARRESPKAAPGWLTRAEELIRDAFPRHVSLSELAGACDVHPAHLARAFRRFKGCTPGDFVRTLRVEAAFRALTETDELLAHVAVASGFYDQSHMGRVLKARFGSTPAQIRKRSRR